MGDYDALSMISKGHNSMSALLSARNKNLQIVRAMWSSGNVRVSATLNIVSIILFQMLLF